MRRLVLHRCIAGFLLLAVAAEGTPAQTPAVARGDAVWQVGDDAFADLWFHCLAVIGYEGAGPLPLYDHDYAAALRSSGQSTLANDATSLRRRLQSDSSFELLHFLPLYFAGREPSAILDALRRVASDGDRAAVRRSSIDDIAARIALSLPTRDQRATLLAIIDAAETDWRSVVGRRRAATTAARTLANGRVEAEWTTRFVPGLSGYFDRLGVRRGTILVSPAVGPEGRVLELADGEIIVVVGAWRSADPLAPQLAAVRELTFPLVRSAARATDERASDIAATRAGALLLAATVPQLAERYRELFRHAAARPSRSFDEAYPADTAADAALRRAVAAVATTPSRRP